eukprot:5525744-Prymnesium_polylepis.2
MIHRMARGVTTGYPPCSSSRRQSPAPSVKVRRALASGSACSPRRTRRHSQTPSGSPWSGLRRAPCGCAQRRAALAAPPQHAAEATPSPNGVVARPHQRRRCRKAPTVANA